MTTNAVAQGCNLLAPPGGGPLYSLYFANGVPFSFPVAFNLLPGSEIDVFAYTDRMFAGCAGIPLEVIDIRVTALPAASADDRNGNLLLDDWELLFLGQLIGDPFADSDADGFSDLQEALDGTDPHDPFSHSTVPIDLSPPEIAIIDGGGGGGASVLSEGVVGLTAVGELDLTWQYPTGYVHAIDFLLEMAPQVPGPYSLSPEAVQYLGAGSYKVTITLGGMTNEFFRVLMMLSSD